MFQADFFVNSLTGYALGTEFVFTNTSTGPNIFQYIWSLGDGTIVYDSANTTHTYKYPGSFTVSLTAIDIRGNISTASKNIDVDLYYRDYIKFTQIPETYSDPGLPTETSFKFEIISSNPNKPIIVDLFATNSKSIPYQFLPNKWNFLLPIWKFTDKNNNFITSLSVLPTPLYYNNTIVGVSGVGEFFYIDSVGTNNQLNDCPVLITATLQTSGFVNYKDSNIFSYNSFANNESVRAGILWQINSQLPTHLKVTSNYLDPINQLQWNGIKIPTIISCHSNRSKLIPGSSNIDSEILFSYPVNNTIGNLNSLSLSLSNLTLNKFEVEGSPLYFQSTTNNFRSGGYIFTTVTPTTAIQDTTIVAMATGFNPPYTDYSLENGFSYPVGLSPNPSVWVSNPNQGTLNKITLTPYPNNCDTINFFKEKNTLVDGIIKEVSVPKVTDNTTFNYSLCGFAGIYGMAIDPRRYDLIACDSELDKLYRISNTGQILDEYDFRNLNDYNPFFKIFSSWFFVTPSVPASGSIYNFYNPTFLSPDSKNYIVQVGGLIQPIDVYTVNPTNKTLTLPIISELAPSDVSVTVTQIFNPTLTSYIDSLGYWLTSTNVATNTYYLTGNAPLLSSTSNYIVAVEGLIQPPDTYTIDTSSRFIIFTENISANYTTQVLYIPGITTPTTWNFSTTANNVTTITLTSVPTFIQNDSSSFLVNVGGILQPDSVAQFDSVDRILILKTPIPANIPVNITQYYVPDFIYQPAAYTPSNVSIDKNYNIWTSLVNTVSVLKFDENLTPLFSVTPSGFPFSEVQFDGDFLLKPPTVETDRFNNCWVTYAHPLCSLLVKYDESGNRLAQIDLPLYSIPVSLTINSKNNVWVSNSYGSSHAKLGQRLNTETDLITANTKIYIQTITNTPTDSITTVDLFTIPIQDNLIVYPLSALDFGFGLVSNLPTNPIYNFYLYETTNSLLGSLQLYDGSTHTLLSSISGINRPSYIAVDRNDNVWFTYDLRNIGYYDTRVNQLYFWKITEQEIISSPEIFTPNLNDEELGGLCVDVYNRVWVIDSSYNNLWAITPAFLPSGPTLQYRKIKIIPNTTIGFYQNNPTQTTYTEQLPDYLYKSAQAAGDWSGNKWYQKYIYPEQLSAIPLYGVSNNFTIDEFTNKYEFKKINESFSNADYYKSLAFPEILNNNKTLFDSFFAAAVGTGQEITSNDIGQTVYEKIGNFILNHADIDTCNIDQLVSLAELVDAPYANYASEFPFDIQRMLNLGSISLSKLFGIENNVPLLPQSLGTQLNTQTDYITAGTKIYLKSKLDNSINLITIPIQDDLLVYPLSSFYGYGFIQPITINYLFYNYDPVYDKTYIENIIDWNATETVLSPTLSTYSDWYKDSGILETIFRYLLTKNLLLK